MSAEPAVPTVIDTNVLVPALYFNTPICRFLEMGYIVLIWNQFILDEYMKIIYRPKLVKMGKRAGVKPEEALEQLKRIVVKGRKTIEMPDNFSPACQDRDDDPFLYAAYHGGVEYIISEDPHLTTLKPYQGIPIGEPGDFFNWAKRMHPMKG